MARDPTKASPTSGHGHPRVSSVNSARLLSLDAGGYRQAITILVYDRKIPVSVNSQTVHPRKLAAVRRELAARAVSSAWGPAIGKVWPFIRSQPGLWTDGHNIFPYHHPTQPGAPILCEFGAEVTRTFETAGEVYATETLGARLPSPSTAAGTIAITRRTTRSENRWRRIGGTPLGTRGRSMEIRRRIRPTPRRRLCTF
jgi:hypothetical protein